LTIEEWQVGSISIGEDSTKRALRRGYRILPSLNSLGLEMLFWARVTMGWMDVNGTEGGEGAAEISVEGDEEAGLEAAGEEGCKWGSMSGWGAGSTEGGEIRGRENGYLEIEEMDSIGEESEWYGNWDSFEDKIMGNV
jgi:hypothetical protein